MACGTTEVELVDLVGTLPIVILPVADRRVAQAIYRQQGSVAGEPMYFADQGGLEGVLAGAQWFRLLEAPDMYPVAYPLGATPLDWRTTLFRVWAPRRTHVAADVVDGAGSFTRSIPMDRDQEGYFQVQADDVACGCRYQFRLDDQLVRPDPAARFLPEGVHGRAEVVSRHSFPWTDQTWTGLCRHELVIYELHLGTFTAAGTLRSAVAQLDRLRDLGITAVELMPLAQCPGRWNWGYDGVGLFAVNHNYGTPDDLRLFVDECHQRGIAVLLDVVYNHLGPEGNYLRDFGPYFSGKHHTPWGEALGYDSRHARPIREFVIENALRWIDEYHLDGLRLDAVHFMFDDSDYDILAELGDRVHAYQQTSGRQLHLIAEANVFDRRLVVPAEGRPRSYSAIWCDDMMHAMYACVTPEIHLTHRRYEKVTDLGEALEHGFLFTGPELRRVAAADRQGLGLPADRSYLASLVVALQTHDAVGNHPHGKRLHQLTSVATQMAAAPLFLLYPAIPMIFMGEEWAVSAHFPFFVDFEDPRLRTSVDKGRAQEYPQHAWDGALAPSDPLAFFRSKIDSESVQHDPQVCHWYRCLLQTRREWMERGWLVPERMSAEWDESGRVFALHYTDGSAGGFVVTRIGEASGRKPVADVTLPGPVLHDSRGTTYPRDQRRVQLQWNHAVVGMRSD